MNLLRKLRKGDWLRVVIRYPGLGRMVEISEEQGEVVGFVQASEQVVAAPSRSSMAAILQREDGRPVLFTPGRDRLVGVGDGVPEEASPAPRASGLGKSRKAAGAGVGVA